MLYGVKALNSILLLSLTLGLKMSPKFYKIIDSLLYYIGLPTIVIIIYIVTYHSFIR